MQLVNDQNNSDQSEDIETMRKRLKFRSWHRGTKEMDLLMGSFADIFLPEMSAEELKIYDGLLYENDPDLYNWISGREDVPERLNSSVMEKLIGHQFARSASQS